MKGRGHCAIIEIESTVARYAYMPAFGRQTSLTLVDRGGPGASLFGPTWPADLVDKLRRRFRHTGLLFIEEPWVTTRPNSACASAASAWYQAFRAGQPLHRSAGTLVDVCHLDADASVWGWTADDYADVVRGIEQQLGWTATRFVGASFGSVRLSYLDRSWARVLMVSPLPSGAPFAEYLELREQGLARFLKGCKLCVSGSSRNVKGRSVPVTSFDRTAALVAAGYLGPAEAAVTYRRIQSGVRAADLALIGTLSDSTLGRVGVSDLSPAVLAIWSEQCRSFSGPRLVEGLGVFSRYYSPCQFIRAPANRPVSLKAKHLCIAVSSTDPVVPESLSLDAYAKSGSTAVERFIGEHAGLVGLSKCLGLRPLERW